MNSEEKNAEISDREREGMCGLVDHNPERCSFHFG